LGSFATNTTRNYDFDSDDYLAFALPTSGSWLTYEIFCYVNPVTRKYGVRNISTHEQTIIVTIVHIKK
jgi:hypothetical protein